LAKLLKAAWGVQYPDMTAQGKKVLTTALRIIASKGDFHLVNIDTDIRPHFASAPERGQGLVEAAIQIVVEAIAISSGDTKTA
jgi:hypothetical protein